MRNPRYVVLGLLALVTFGSLALTGGYAWYWHSARYRQYCANMLMKHLGLPAEIGRVIPRSRHAREFRDVKVWLPQHRGEAAECLSALLRAAPTPTEPDAYELELRGGRTEISAQTWLREDYRFMLESGLRPGFDPQGPRRITFSGMDLGFERGPFRATLHGASGVVSFTDPHLGRATIRCRELNGQVATQDVVLQGRFSPQDGGIRLDEIVLQVPELPIALLGLRDLVGLSLTTGAFRGELVYRETEPPVPVPTTAPTRDDRELVLRGRLVDLQLSECTAGFLVPPWRGSVPELELEDLTLRNGHPAHLQFHGVLGGIELGDMLAPWNLQGVGGHLRLTVRNADLSPAGIDTFIAAGRCDRVSLEDVSRALGWGRMTGHAQLVVQDLTIRENRLASLDATIIVQPAAGQPNTIERELLSAVLTRTLGITLPSFLPDRFEYSQLGVRLEVRDEMLRVYGTHGPREKAILTVNLGGQEVPVVFEPEDAFDLKPALEPWREGLLPQISARLRTMTPQDAWRAISARGGRPASTSAPASVPDRGEP